MNVKCEQTGKAIFDTLTGAREKMYQFRFRNWDNVSRKRVNRHCKKPEQKRAYHCEYCNGYHLTSQEVFKTNIKSK